VERHSGLSEKLIHRMGTDSVLRLMFELKLPLTRETYIAYNWGSDLPKPGPEFELDLQEPFRQPPGGSATSGMSGPSSGPRQAPATQRPVPGGPPMRTPRSCASLIPCGYRRELSATGRTNSAVTALTTNAPLVRASASVSLRSRCRVRR
jgi:hypothetical protein